MLRYDFDNENETIRNYRDRIRQSEKLWECAMAEQISQILMQEHQIDLATAPGIKVPDVAVVPKDARSVKICRALSATAPRIRTRSRPIGWRLHLEYIRL